MTNIFEYAVREKLRFRSDKGDLLTEQLFDLPLTKAGSALSLDYLARNIAKQLKEEEDVSFVNPKPDTGRKRLEIQLEILKFVIAEKQKEEADRKAAAEKRARKQRILEALSEKEDEEFKSKSKEELLKELEEL